MNSYFKLEIQVTTGNLHSKIFLLFKKNSNHNNCLFKSRKRENMFANRKTLELAKGWFLFAVPCS